MGLFTWHRALAQCIITTDLKNRTGLSIYFWETEANGGYIEGTT